MIFVPLCNGSQGHSQKARKQHYRQQILVCTLAVTSSLLCVLLSLATATLVLITVLSNVVDIKYLEMWTKVLSIDSEVFCNQRHSVTATAYH